MVGLVNPSIDEIPRPMMLIIDEMSFPQRFRKDQNIHSAQFKGLR